MGQKSEIVKNRGILLAYDFPPGKGGIHRFMHQTVSADTGWNWLVMTRKCQGSEYWDQRQPYKTHRITLRPNLRLSDKIWLRFSKGNNLVDRLISRQICSNIKRYKPNGRTHLTLADQLVTAAAARRISFSQRLPFGVFVHGKELLVATPFQKEILSQAALVIGNSKWSITKAVELGTRKPCAHVLNPCADVNKFGVGNRRHGCEMLGLPGNCKVLLTVAALVKRKGHDLVIEALPQLRRRFGDVRYVIVGTGPEEQNLKSLVISKGLSDAVIFAGSVKDEQLPDMYAACDIFVMPSRQTDKDVEGFGIVFIEAAAAGKPVVASRTGGIPDAVADGKSGILVNPNNSNELIRAIESLLNNQQLRETMAEYGRKRAREFDENAFAERLSDILDHCVLE